MLVNDSEDDQKVNDTDSFEVTVNDFPRVQVNETQRDVMKLHSTRIRNE
jgi:hypothetical protein